jgi:CubicO group peptidase (beta-lactamase class C family)
MTLPIHGHCHTDFERVRDVFVENFDKYEQVGARLAIIHENETVVDLWGGYKTTALDSEWRDDTIVCCMSVTKGVVALAAHLLAERGLLDYDAPVTEYWPEFGAAGKQDTSVRQAISHQASLAFLDAAEPGDALDWATMIEKIGAQAPNWPVATNECYHSITIGYITGELVRRIDGRPIEQFIREELTMPLGSDYVLGCSDADVGKVVAQINNPDNQLMNGGLINERSMGMFAPMPADPAFMGSDDSLRAILPSGGGVASALGIAKLFAPFANGGAYNGVQLYSPETIALACEEQWHHDDSVFGNEFRVALGLLLHCGFNNWGREGNVGTAGAGGYSAFADPEHHIAYGYTPNKFTTGYGLGEEHDRLIAALYESL